MSGREVDIAIVGAGAAGIAAARALQGHPLSVLVLDAADRAGGRAFTRVFDGMACDIGCGWLHSADRNPLVELGEQHGFTIDRSPPHWRQQAGHQGMSDAEQRDYWAAYRAWEDRVLADAAKGVDRSAEALLDPGNRWNPMIDAISTYVNGAETRTLSTLDYAAYTNAATDKNWRVAEGYGALIARLGGEVSVVLGAPVSEIDYNGPAVRLATRRGEVIARAAIVSVATDVLAAEAIRFDPPIPDTLEAAGALPLGLADKLLLRFDEPEMFPSDAHLFGRTDSSETGSYHLRPFGRPLIEVFFGGAHAEALEKGGMAEFAGFAIDELAGLIGSKMRRKLHPLAASAWRADPWIKGSYSHALPGHADARASLRQSVNDRLFFAGEACSANDFSTCHGAWQSGLDAAQQVLEALNLAVPAEH